MAKTHSQPPSCFVNDLIPIILECNDHWWPQDLLRLASVSMEWMIHIRRRLYACPTILSFHNCTLLARTLTENPRLLTLMSGIDLRPMVTGVYHDRPLTAKERNSLKFLLGVDGLRIVRLGGQLAVKAERFLSMLGDTDEVTELHIDGSLLQESMSSPPSLEWDESTALRFPMLKKLQLTELQLDIIPPSISTPFSIDALILENVEIISGYLSHILPGRGSLGCLRVLTKDGSEFDEQIRVVLDECAVESLHYEVQGSNGSLERAIFDGESLSSPSLRCLHLRGFHVDVDTLGWIEQHYQRLEELVVCGRTIRVRAEEWAGFVRSGALPSLRRMEVSWGTNHPPYAAWDAVATAGVVEAATVRNIELVGC